MPRPDPSLPNKKFVSYRLEMRYNACMSRNENNQDLFHTHLEVFNEQGNFWEVVENSIKMVVHKDMDRRYKLIEKKIKWLEDKRRGGVGNNQK